MIKTTLLTKGVRYGVALFSTSECFEWQLMGHLQVLQCASTTMWKFFITLNWGWFQCIIHQCKIIVCHSIWQHCGDTFCWVLSTAATLLCTVIHEKARLWRSELWIYDGFENQDVSSWKTATRLRLSENIARFENAVSCRSLLKDDNEIAILKCQKFNEYYNVHRSLGLILRLFSKCLCLCHCLFVGQVKSPHHSDQMSQRSQVSEGALW